MPHLGVRHVAAVQARFEEPYWPVLPVAEPGPNHGSKPPADFRSLTKAAQFKTRKMDDVIAAVAGSRIHPFADGGKYGRSQGAGGTSNSA